MACSEGRYVNVGSPEPNRMENSATSVIARSRAGYGKSESHITRSTGKPCTWGRTRGSSVEEREMCMAITKAFENTETKLKRLKQRSIMNPGCEMQWLMPFFNIEGLEAWFQELDAKKATGIDGVSKDDYGMNLRNNLDELVCRMKSFSYRPGAVREVLIPKGDGKSMRPLGIGNLEDKIVQTGISKILEAIYEPSFYDLSYGFRPNRSCHMAVKELSNYLYRQPVDCVIDVDLRNFFGTIRHNLLIDILRLRIKDEVFLRYIARTLKAGILRDGNFVVSDEGTPQGSPASPILANIFAHYVLDAWFEEMVKPVMRGKVCMFRYADDFVICCELEYDAQRIMKGLKNRLVKYSLELNETKTKIVSFSRNRLRNGQRQGTFDFLGFTFYIGKSRGKKIPVVKLKTSRKRFVAKLKRVREWVAAHRCKVRMRPLWDMFRRKLQGHIQYYGVSDNTKYVGNFLWEASRIFFKWMNRRSQKKSLTWKQYNNFVKLYPLPIAKVHFKLY